MIDEKVKRDLVLVRTTYDSICLVSSLVVSILPHDGAKAALVIFYL